MNIEVTDEQLRKIAALAINASAPVGMGFIRYSPGDVDTADLNVKYGVSLDYVQGRMVKLNISRAPGSKLVEMPYGVPRREYQSWAGKYPTYAELFEAAGVAVPK